ncbi:MAG: methyltransferase domain-containing protein [Verrucomicrobiota bacterium]
MKNHQALILDQFTQGAPLFASAPQITDASALKLVVRLAETGPADTVLDVACGPGLLACAFAGTARHATGIDLTPAMIDRARALQVEKGLANVTWQLGDVTPLPFAEASFSVVTARYAFHHFLDPEAVLEEMKRVCQPGGRVAVIDVIASAVPEQAGAFNRMEKLRDPSHVRALTLAELRALLSRHGLAVVQEAFYKLEFELEAVLKGSFPSQGDAEIVRQMFVDSLADNALGLDSRRANGEIRFAYPIAVLVAERGG